MENHALELYDSSSWKVFVKYVDVTAESCQAVCDDLLSDSCCTLVFIRDSNTCYITAIETSIEGAHLEPHAGVDTYLKKQCAGTYKFIYSECLNTYHL